MKNSDILGVIISLPIGFLLASLMFYSSPAETIHQAARFRITHSNGHVYHSHEFQLNGGMLMFRDEASRMITIVPTSSVVIEDTQ